MADVIWSCPDCGTDLEQDWWCPGCEQLWFARAIADWEEPFDYYDHEDDDDGV